MKDIMRHLVCDHEGEFVVGLALIEHGGGDYNAFAIGPGIHIAAGQELDARRAAEICAQEHVAVAANPGDTKRDRAFFRLVGDDFLYAFRGGPAGHSIVSDAQLQSIDGYQAIIGREPRHICWATRNHRHHAQMVVEPIAAASALSGGLKILANAMHDEAQLGLEPFTTQALARYG